MSRFALVIFLLTFGLNFLTNYFYFLQRSEIFL
jgi:hypothetical protein